jgi:hypothetical protein
LKFIFRDMSEWRMSKVVREGCCTNDNRVDAAGALDSLRLILTEVLAEAFADLRNFKRVREPVVEELGFARVHNLRHVSEAAKGGRIEDAVAVSGCRAPVVGRLLCAARSAPKVPR